MKFDKFWKNVRIDPCGCWIWYGYVNKFGYGAVTVKNIGRPDTSTTAHRFLFELMGGTDVEPGFDLHHLCKNKRCVNPSHLQKLTRIEHAKERMLASPKCGHAFDHLHRTKSGKIARRCFTCLRKRNASYALKNKLRSLYREAT